MKRQLDEEAPLALSLLDKLVPELLMLILSHVQAPQPRIRLYLPVRGACRCLRDTIDQNLGTNTTTTTTIKDEEKTRNPWFGILPPPLETAIPSIWPHRKYQETLRMAAFSNRTFHALNASGYLDAMINDTFKEDPFIRSKTISELSSMFNVRLMLDRKTLSAMPPHRQIGYLLTLNDLASAFRNDGYATARDWENTSICGHTYLYREQATGRSTELEKRKDGEPYVCTKKGERLYLVNFHPLRQANFGEPIEQCRVIELQGTDRMMRLKHSNTMLNSLNVTFCKLYPLVEYLKKNYNLSWMDWSRKNSMTERRKKAPQKGKNV